MAPKPKAEIMRCTRAEHRRLWSQIDDILVRTGVPPENNKTSERLICVLTILRDMDNRQNRLVKA